MGRRAIAVVVVLLTAACGRLNYETLSAPGVDAGPAIDSGVRIDAGMGDAGRQPDAGPTDWWDPSFTRRMRLDLDRSAPTEDLTDFPLLVVLDATRFDRGLARPGLEDLRFVTAAGVVLDHELEENSTATVFAWVRMPTIAAGMRPTIWLYFGNPSANAIAGTVFGADYVGVWHLDDVGDATTPRNDGVLTGGSWVDGRIGSAIDFAGGGSHIRIPDDASLHWSGGITVSGWMRLRTYLEACSAVLTRQRVENDTWNNFFLASCTGSAHGQSFPALLMTPDQSPLGTWVHLAMAYDAPTLTVYRDGVPVLSDTLPAPPGSAARPIYMGADRNGAAGGPSNGFIDGTIDEVRLQSVGRSAAWLAADYVSNTDAWITYSPVEP